MNLTLNILPPKKKHALRTARAMAFLQSLALFLALLILIATSLLVSLRLIIQNKVESNARQTNNSFEEYEQLTNQMKNINGYIDRVDDIHGSFIDWSAVLEQLGHAAPHGLKFEGVTISPDLIVTVEGTAETRDDVLAMEKQLNDYPYFTEVSSPLSNILQKKNLRFEFRMKFVPPEKE